MAAQSLQNLFPSLHAAVSEGEVGRWLEWEDVYLFVGLATVSLIQDEVRNILRIDCAHVCKQTEFRGRGLVLDLCYG